ncbi:MAG: hypothetical protein ACE5Q6_10035, partial [Dehalococcoidia bacterium]
MPFITAEGPSPILSQLSAFFSSRQIDAFLVGGFVRDSLLSLPSRDVDIALKGDALAVGRELALQLKGVFVPLSERHSVARLIVPDPEGVSWTVDLTSYSGTIEEYLARRDFSANALALPLAEWAAPEWPEAVIDPCNGRGDMARKHIRALNPGVFQEDPGRLLRSVRLAARLKFRLEPETAQLVRAEAHRMSLVAPERLRDEFLLVLASDGTRGQLETLDRLDLLCRLIPELELTKGVTQPRNHH